jgi:hypothetical protein
MRKRLAHEERPASEEVLPGCEDVCHTFSGCIYISLNLIRNKYPPALPEVLRLLAPQRGLTAIAKSNPQTEKTTNGRLPELSDFGSPPAEPGVYHD